MIELVLDTETSGLLNSKPVPWIMEFAACLYDNDKCVASVDFLIEALERTVHPKAFEAHGITIEDCDKYGFFEPFALEIIQEFFLKANIIIGYNVRFDLGILLGVVNESEKSDNYKSIITVATGVPKLDIMVLGTDVCKIPGYYGKWKWPKLGELYQHLFNEPLEGAHNALVDVQATYRCYQKLKEMGVITEEMLNRFNTNDIK